MICSVLLMLLAASPLDSARQLYDDAEYAEAVAAYDELLERPDLSEAQKQEALLYLGFAQLGLRHDDAARRQFRRLLEKAPRYVLPAYTSPRLVTVFEQVRREVTAKSDIALRGVHKTPTDTGTHVELEFLVAKTGVAHALLFWRWQGDPVFNELALGENGGIAEGAIDAPKDHTVMEYYAELRSDDKVLAAVGSAAQPLLADWTPRGAPMSAPVAVARPTPVYKAWWLWTTIGVVVAGAGAGTAAYLLTRPTSGTVTLTLSGAR